MKKSIAWLFAVCLVLFTGCAPAPSVCDTLTALAQKEYAGIRLEVTVSEGGNTLSGSYETKAVADGYTVEYSYQQFATVAENGGELVFPDAAVVTKSGKMTVRSGEIVSREGDGADLPLGTLTAAGMHFDEKNFSSPEEEAGKFSAQIVDPAKFSEGLTGSGARLEALYTAEGLDRVTVTLTAGSASVRFEYRFQIA